jgi:hypothetical protein
VFQQMAGPMESLRTIKWHKLDSYDNYFAPIKSVEEPFDQNFCIVCSDSFRPVMEKDSHIEGITFCLNL